LFKSQLIELVDRHTIAQIKHKRTEGTNQLELDYYTAQLKEFDFKKRSGWLNALKDFQDTFWNLEDDFKKCKLDNIDIAEIGRRG